jgi:hypothetical protein
MEKLLTQGNGRPEKRMQSGFRAGWDSARWLVPFTLYLFPLCLIAAFLWHGFRVLWQHRHGLLLGGSILIAGLLLLGLDWAWLWIWKRLRPGAPVKEPASMALYRMGAVLSLVLILAGLVLLLTNPLPWRPPPNPLTPG